MENKEIILGFLQRDLDHVIQEARLIALQHVKEKLVLSFEELLFEAALKKMENDLLSRSDTYSETDNSALGEDDQLSIQENKKTYLYGITEREADAFITQKRLPGMVDGEQVYAVPYKDLIGVVCEVPEEEFNEVKIQELTENRDWLGEKAERHQRTISALAEKHPVVPMRFCSLYPSHSQLKVFMADNYVDLKDLLKKIINKTEWGLKLFLHEERFKEFLQEKDESINNLIDELSLNQTGKGYLPQKRLANSIERKAFDLAEEVHRRLCRFSTGAVINKLLPQEITGRTEKMILNGAYLLERNQEEEFLQTVKWLEETEEPRGFIFEISGPWPCYNFCQISSTST